MNKKIFAALFVMVLSVACFGYTAKSEAAQDTDPKFSIGGIELGMTLDEVKNILGEPASQVEHDEFVFENGLVIEFEDNSNTVENIKTRRNGMATDAGVAVGMPAEKLSEFYGTADRIENNHDKTEYKYYAANGMYKIKFTVRNGIIEKIESEIRD